MQSQPIPGYDNVAWQIPTRLLQVPQYALAGGQQYGGCRPR